ADGHINVCHIKDREINQGKINKIHHIIQPDPVYAVSNPSGGKEKAQKLDRKEFFIRRKSPQDIADRSQDHKGQEQEEDLLLLEDPESSSTVLQIMKIQDIGDQLHIGLIFQMLYCQQFGPLVCKDQHCR